MLQLELSNIKDIYNSGEATITSAIKLLQSNQLQTHICHKRSLLPFLGDALSWLTGTATTKDIHSIKTRINWLIAAQASQQETLVHIVSILNITRYATQVNRCGINVLMDAVRATSHDINNLYNLTTSLATSINLHQLILHIRSVFAKLCDSLSYIQMVSTHTMDYINAATSGALSPYVLPAMDLQRMLQYVADTLPPTLHLPISPEDNLHFYRYLHNHVLIENKQFLLLVDVPILDRSRQITIHKTLTLDIPQGNYSAHYDVGTKYLGITKDATMAVELSTTQFQACQEANGQFCSITTPFQSLANLPSCIAALYAKGTADITSKCSLQIWKASITNLPTQIAPDVWIRTTPLAAPVNTMTLICPEKAMETITIQKPVHILRLPTACSVTSPKFYLLPRYETLTLDVNILLSMANLHMINISAQDFYIWKHLGSNRSDMPLQHLTAIPLILIHKIYQHLLNNTLPIIPFDKESTEHTGSIWTLFSHLGIYISAIGSLIPVGLGLF